MIQSYATAEDAMKAAQCQRVGGVVCVGPETGQDREISALPQADLRRLPGPSSWLSRDLGCEPSVWAEFNGAVLSAITGESLVACTRRFLDPRLTLDDARGILAAAAGLK